MTATADPRAGQTTPPPITTRFYYDTDTGTPLTRGNLKRIVEAEGSAEQQETKFEYGTGSELTWGLPISSVNAVGAVTSYQYHGTHGGLRYVTSPQNLAVPPGHPDYAPSVTEIQYNTDDLPSAMLDPLMHRIDIEYRADSADTRNLIVKLIHGDGSYREVTLDAKGRLIKSRDENNPAVVNQWTYTPAGEIKTITRAAGTADAATTQFDYDSRGDLWRIVPPMGTAGRVEFSYDTYTQSGAPTGIYEGQVTRIRHPDATYEFFGFDSAGDLDWHKKQNGDLIDINRDEQHRVQQLIYPASGGLPGFTVAYEYDGFGRTVRTTDAEGQTVLGYDSLHRITQVTPPAPQKAISYQYLKNVTCLIGNPPVPIDCKRWTTRVNVAGVGIYEYREDTKGRLAEVLTPFSANTLRLEYDPDGKNTVTTFPNGAQEWRYYTFGANDPRNTRDWLSFQELYRSNGYHATFVYNYRPNGQLLSETDGAWVHSFGYNSRNELRTESDPFAGNITYNVNANGNRISRLVNGVTENYGLPITPTGWNGFGSVARTVSQAAPARSRTRCSATTPTADPTSASGATSRTARWNPGPGLGRRR
jgi:YD repeat-containing protein